MASPKFAAYPTDPFSPAVRTLIDLLREDPLFADLNPNLRFWSGSKRDSARPAAGGELPWVRVTARGGASDWSHSGGAGNRSHAVTLSVTVEIAVEGSDAEDLRILFSLILGAWLPPDRDAAVAVLARYKAAGIYGPPTLREPALGPEAGEAAQAQISATALFEFPMLVRT